MIEVRHFIDRSGRIPFERWFQKLNAEVQARITIALDRIERGNLSGVKSVGVGVIELRLDFGPGYRFISGAMEIELSSSSAAARRRGNKRTSSPREFCCGNTRKERGRGDGSYEGIQ